MDTPAAGIDATAILETDTSERLAFYERIGRDNLMPLGTSLANLVTPEPSSPCQHEGDCMITPPLAWHDHDNPSEQPIFWLDGLDTPVVSFLDTLFAERLDQDEQPINRLVGDSDARYGANLLPVDHLDGGGLLPVFNHPYDRTRDDDFVVECSKPNQFVVPSWHKVRHEAAEDSVLFSFSDRPFQARHQFDEDRGNV